MSEDEPDNDELQKYRARSSSSGGRGGGRRRTRVGSGGDDESIFNEIMLVLRKIERETGRVPTLQELSLKTGIAVNRIREVLSKRLPEVTVDGDTEFETSLRGILFEHGRGLITPEEWNHIQAERDRTGEPISLILARLGLANENQLKNALELQYGVNYVPLLKIAPPQPECFALLPDEMIRQFMVNPIEKKGNRLTIAMVNPNNLTALDNIKALLKDVRIRLCVCTEADFNLFIEEAFGSQTSEIVDPNIQD
jgi:hypothetical protein